MSKNIIGIDLGSSTSCVAIYKNGKPETIPNEQGNRIIPSIVAFDKTLLVGDKAKTFLYKNLDQTITNVKRFIGRSYSEFEELIKKKELKIFYKTKKDPKRDAPMIKIQYKDKLYQLSPEQVSSLILIYLKKQVLNHIKEKVTDAVITVPADFNQKQINATADAAKIAGLNVLRIIKEPVAAAIAYADDKQLNNMQKVVIFDFGGGTLDISILSLNKGFYEVIISKGNNLLGGEDFDDILVEFCIQEFNNTCQINLNQYSDENDEKKKVKAKCRLKIACEKAKKELSFIQESNIDINNLFEGEDFQITISRTEFEEKCKTLFEKTENLLKEVFEESKINKEEINDVILVGGTSNIPKVQEIVREFFKNKFNFKNEKINKDELVASGAAIQASIIVGEYKKSLIVKDKYNKTIGMGIAGGKMSVIFPKNSDIPNQVKKKFKTNKDNQTIIKFSLFEGENEYVKDNIKIASFEINVPPLPAKKVVLEVNFVLDVNSVLSINGVEKNLGIKFEKQFNFNDMNENDILEKKKQNYSMIGSFTTISSNNSSIFKSNKSINLNTDIKDFENKLMQVESNEYGLFQENYISILSQYLNAYLIYLENNTPRDEKEVEYHFKRISKYVNKVNFTNSSELIPVIKILKDKSEIYYNVVYDYLNKYYNECVDLFKNEKYSEAKLGFNDIKTSLKDSNIGENLYNCFPLKENIYRISNGINNYLNRIKINEYLLSGDEIFKNNPLNYSSIIEKYNEAYKTLKINGEKDYEYEAKCLSKIVIIKYKNSNNEYKRQTEILDIIGKIDELLNKTNKKLIEKEDWYKEYIIIKNQLVTPTPNGDNNFNLTHEKNDPVQQIEKNFKNLNNSDFIEYITQNYPPENSGIFENVKSEFIKNPKVIIKKLSFEYHTDRIKEKNSAEGKKRFNINDKISKILNSMLIDQNSQSIK